MNFIGHFVQVPQVQTSQTPHFTSKGAKENEDQGFKEFYEKPNKEDPTKEDQDGRYPLSAINRLTLNMLKVSKKIFWFHKNMGQIFWKAVGREGQQYKGCSKSLSQKDEQENQQVWN